MNRQQLYGLIFILLAVAAGIAAFYFFTGGREMTGFLCVITGIIFIILAQVSALSPFRKTEKLLLAIQKKDFSLFPQAEGNPLTDSAVKLYHQAREDHFSQTSYRLLYEEILNQLEIGLMILSGNGNGDGQGWEIFYVNPVFLDILQVPKYSSWDLYREKIPEFYRIIDQSGYGNSQEFFDVSINKNSRQSFSLRTKQVKSASHHFCIISLESVQKIIEQKEKLAWNNLMKVISHELLNTLTPVNSLIQNLEYIANQETIEKEDQEDMKESLMIISSKSEQLLNFVDDYRQVAELPKPVLKEISLSGVAESALRFLKTGFDKNGIRVTGSWEEVHLMADRKMIERCLINLYLNAIHALAGSPEKEIRTEIRTVGNRIVLSIEDTGAGIREEIRDRIFLPFFTTRDNGSGIGLTLSKSIIEAHYGYLNYRPLEQGSRFEIWFVQ